MEERPSVLAVRPAVDLQHERVQLARVETIGFQNPALDHPPVRCGELVALGLSDVAVMKPRIEVREARLRPVRHDVQLPRIA